MNFWSRWSHEETLRPNATGISTRAVAPAVTLSAQWSAAIMGLAFALVGGGLIFSSTVGHTVSTWYQSVTFNHGFLIVPICLYLAWERRGRLAAIAPSVNAWGLAAVAATAAAWMLGNLAVVQLVQQFAFVALIQASCVAVLGLKAARALVFPLGYLVFAVPFGESLVPHLQNVTATFVVWALRLIDIPVFVDGVFLSIPTGNFVVAEACSGVRYLLATVALGFLFADLTYKSLLRKALFVALSFGVPIVANGVRAFGIVYIAHVTDHKVAVGVDHIVYGWVFFAIVTVLLIAIGTTFREAESALPAAPALPRTHGSIGPKGAPNYARRVAALVIAMLAILAAARAYADYANHADRAAEGAPLQLPPAPIGWTRFDSYVDSWQPEFAGADESRLATYAKDGRAVHLFIALYRQQREGAELVSSANSIADQNWARAGSGVARAVVNGDPIAVEMTRMVRKGRGRIAWHWFWVGGTYTASPYAAKALETRVKLLDEPRGAAVVAIAADYGETPAEAEALLGDFLRGLDPIEPGLQRATGE